MKQINITEDEETLRRLWPLIVPSETCWHFKGHHDVQGYTIFWMGGSAYKGHRVVYTLVRGTIGEGLVLDHLCRNRWCVNPFHLEAVTDAENVLRGEGPPAQYARRKTCVHGHPLIGNNVRQDKGRRTCRTCKRAQNRLWATRKRAGLVSGTDQTDREVPA